MTKIFAGMLLGLLIGAGCRYFDIPVPSPPKLVGALLVVAMTVGYTLTDRYLSGRGADEATTARLCGGPTGETAGGGKGPRALKSAAAAARATLKHQN